VKQGLCLNRGYADVYSIATDDSGNVFEAGLGEGRLVFGSDTIIPKYNIPYYAFLVKYDFNGNVLWTKKANNDINSYANYVTIDDSRNSYITGDFTDTIAFDSIKLNRIGIYSFLTCYSPTGKVKWAISDSNNSSHSYAVSNCVCKDRFKNVYITGWYIDTIFFGSYMLTSKKSTQNTFIVKYDSTGKVLWAKNSTLASSRCYSNGQAVASDDSGNIYLTGIFIDTISIGSFTLRNKGISWNTFVVKYDSSGNAQWVQYPLIANSSGSYSTAIAVDNFRNPYITGFFEDTVICGMDTLRGKYQSAFIFKLSPNGQFIWSKGSINTSKHNGSPWPYSVVVDKSKNIYTCGTFQDSLNFCGIFLTSDSIEPSYLIKTDSMGNGICGALINNINDDQNALAIDPLSNDVYFGGDYDNSKCIFGSDTLVNVPNLGENSFLAKWEPCNNIGTSINPISNNPSLSLFPNPNTGAFTLEVNSEELRAKSSVEIYNVMGQKVFASCQPQTPKGALIAVNIGNQPNGVYLYRVIDETGKLLGEGKFVIEK